MDAPAPPPPAPGRPQAVLAAVALAAIGLLAFRGYGGHLGTRPTDHLPSPSRSRVDVNAADRTELLQVPGIGPNLADAILTHRRDRGPFAAVDHLADVRGIGDKTLDQLRPWVTVSAAPSFPPPEPPVERLERKPPRDLPPFAIPTKLRLGDPPVDLNTADETGLQRLPGIGPTLARRIVDARGVDRFKSPDDLRRVKGIGPKTMESVRPYVVCR